MNDKDTVIDKVLQQIVKDVEFGDLTAIAELLTKVDEDYLQAYLPEA